MDDEKRTAAYENALRQIAASKPSWAQPWEVAVNVLVWGEAFADPLHLKTTRRDGTPVIYGSCPGCGEWCELDDEMLHGRVSTHHDVPGCGFHETKNWWADHVAEAADSGRPSDLDSVLNEHDRCDTPEGFDHDRCLAPDDPHKASASGRKPPPS